MVPSEVKNGENTNWGRFLTLLQFFSRLFKKTSPSFFTTVVGGLLLLFLHYNLFTLMIVAGIILAIVAFLRYCVIYGIVVKININLSKDCNCNQFLSII